MAKCSLTISAQVHAPSMSLDTMHGVCAAALTGSHSGWALVVEEPLWENFAIEYYYYYYLVTIVPQVFVVPTYKVS